MGKVLKNEIISSSECVLTVTDKKGRQFQILEWDRDVLDQYWTVMKNGVVGRQYVEDNKQKCELLHRRILKAPHGAVVVHKNGDKSDNRRFNLYFGHEL